jgi:hypothetical protein
MHDPAHHGLRRPSRTAMRAAAAVSHPASPACRWRWATGWPSATTPRAGDPAGLVARAPAAARAVDRCRARGHDDQAQHGSGRPAVRQSLATGRS